MNINIQAHILKIASQMLCEQVTNGNTLVATKVRDHGDIVEWHLMNGDMIEIINNKDYSTGICITPSTSICLYKDNVITNEQVFINK
jgi:hypothetical protein